MHVVEATTIMKNDPPIGRGDVSPCLPSWIKTMCNAFQKGEGYTLSHNAVSALCHTLIGARVRAERLVQERDEALRDRNRLLAAIDCWSYCMTQGMKISCPEKAGELAEFLISCEVKQDAGGRY